MQNLKLPTLIKATYKIITPMFIGDAEQNATRIAPQSVKGALRFWWRALVWDQIIRAEQDEVKALNELHHQEAILFGSSATNKRSNRSNKEEECYGKGLVSIRVVADKLTTKNKGVIHDKLASRTGARYLGYGVIHAFSSKKGKLGELIRDCIDEHQSFEVHIMCSEQANSELEALKNALKLMGLLGGLGSRARKGYGSINLTSLEVDNKKDWNEPKSFDEYNNILSSIIGDISSNKIPPFSALSKNTLIKKIVEAKSEYEALNDYGTKMIFYRSWGRNGEVLGTISQRNFKGDHDFIKNVAGLLKDMSNFHPRRVVFGLPHTYTKTFGLRSVKYERRASPLFYHVHQFGNDFIGISFILKSTFLPLGDNINVVISDSRGKNTKSITPKIEWDVIEKNFLNDEKRFNKAVTIFPIGGKHE